MTRLLFVDDEPRVLDGLRQSLRSKRKVWEMAFANGGVAALQELEQKSFDVVISDMRMPGMDGADLLARVAILQPQAVRMVLSGQMEEEAAARAAAVAHRFLAKPCDSETLVGTLTRALELKALLNSDQIRNCIGGMASLPSLPRTCLLLNQALAQEKTSLQAVAEIIEQDTGVAAKVLQLVNSAFFGASRRITSLSQAVSYLGVGTLRSLVLAESLYEQLCTGDVALMEREQQASTLVAWVARRLLTDERQTETAFTAGLLRDVGALALLCRLPAEWAANETFARSKAIQLHEAERERLGVTHAGIGAYLLGLWGLPHEVIDAVAAHHDPWDSFAVLDARLAVRIADTLVRCMPGTAVPAAPVSDLPPEVLQQFGLSAVVDALRPRIEVMGGSRGAPS